MRSVTCIQSGNLVFTTAASIEEVESELEQAITRRFGFAVDVIAGCGPHDRGFGERG